MEFQKINIFNKHETLLKILYHIGGGVMFITHISNFMRYQYKNQLWRDLNELIDARLVDKIKYHKHCLIKIKSFAIKSILHKDKVDSIVITGSKILKSAMICSIILNSYQHVCSNPEEYLNKLKKCSNFYYPNDYNLYLYKQLRETFNNYNMDTESIENEILKITETAPVHKQYLINYKTQNIFIEKYGVRKVTGEFIIKLAYLDLSSEFSPVRIAKRIGEFIEYCNSIFMNNLNIVGRKQIRYIFSIYTQNALRLEYIQRQMKKIESYLRCQGVYLTSLSFNIINLNLTSTLFSNQIIIL